jgi:ubiquinone/menaquinone biosynthesis C-methylase UbiE
MNNSQLLKCLDEIDRISTEQWLASLTPRGKAELDFHNKHREPSRPQTASEDTYEKFYGNKKYYTTVQRSLDYTRDWIARHSPGKVVLDYACGNGQLAIQAAQAGAQLAIGLDISDVSIRNAQAEAARIGVTNVRFVQSNAEATRLPDESVDVVLCSGMLHHLDLSYAFPELRRIMKVGGKILAIEALDYNPAIKLYRHLTPQMRTEWEKAHILDWRDLRFAERFFDIGDVRYWHVLGYAGGKFPALLGAFSKIDTVLERIPLVQLMAWIWTFELAKGEKA